MTTQQKLEDLGPEQLQFLLDNIDNLSEVQLRSFYGETGATVEAVQKENCQDSFMDFAHKVWPNFIDGAPSCQNGCSV
jgi:hypothetical protein